MGNAQAAPKRNEVVVLPLAPMSGIVDAFQTSHYGGSVTDQMALGKLRRDWAIITDFIAGQDLAQQESQK